MRLSEKQIREALNILDATFELLNSSAYNPEAICDCYKACIAVLRAPYKDQDIEFYDMGYTETLNTLELMCSNGAPSYILTTFLYSALLKLLP